MIELKFNTMSKHKLLRPHNGQRDGEEVELHTEEQVNYFQRIGLIAAPKAEKEPVTTKEHKGKIKNKAKK